MPTPEEIADNLQRFGAQSPFYAQAEDDARKAAADALAAHRRWEIETSGNDPFESSPETTQLVYLDFLRRARVARNIPTSMRSADIASVATPDGQETATGVLGGIKKGIQAGAMRVGALTASPFLSEEDSAANFAAANKRSSEVSGMPAEIAGAVAQTGTEMAPLIAGSLVTGGAVLPTLGAGAARATALGAASVGGGLQSAVPEYFERRGGQAGGPIGTPSTPSMAPGQAAAVATAKGLSTTAVTALFGLTGAEALANPVARQAVRSGIKEMLVAAGHGAAKEGVEEATDELFQAWADKSIAGDNVTAGDFVTRAMKAGALGALFGAGGEALAHARDAHGAAPAAAPAVPPVSAPLPKPAAPAAPAGPSAAPIGPVSPRQIGVVMRGVVNGSVQPESLAPEARAQVADALRKQLPAGAPVPPELQSVLAKLEPSNAAVVPQPSVAPVVPAPPQSVVPPGPGPVPAPVFPPMQTGAKPVASPSPQPAVAPVSAPTPSPSPAPAVEPLSKTPYKDVLLQHLQELDAAHARAKAALANPPEIPVESKVSSVPTEESKQVNQGQEVQGQGRQEGLLKPDLDTEISQSLEHPGKLGRLVDRGVRTGPAPEDPAELARWQQRLTPVQADRILAHLGDQPKGLNKQTQVKLLRYLGKTPVVERRLHEGGFTPKDAIAERQAAPPVSPTAPTERIEKPKPPGETSAKVPLFITKRMEKELRGLGYKDEDLGPMTAKQANDILENGTPRREYAPPKPTETSHAEEVRSHAGPVPETGTVESRSGDQGRKDLQRRTEARPAPSNPEQQVAPPKRRAFDVAEEPSSPTYVNRVRERVSEAIAKRRKTGGTAIRPGVDPLIKELGDNPTVDTNAKVAAAVRKRVVGKAKVNGKETTLYESPNSWGKPINEYVDLHRKYGRTLRAERAVRESGRTLDRSSMQLSELPADAPSDLRSRLAAVRDKAQAEHEAARAKLTKAGKQPPSQADRDRLTQLSAEIRGYFAEGIAKQAADLIRATPAEKREQAAARIESKIENNDLTDLVSDELVDPATLSGVNSRTFLADYGGKFALVSPDPKKPGAYQTLNRLGERDPKDPFVTDQLGELFDTLATRDLHSPMAAAESSVEGLSPELAAHAIKHGQAGPVSVTDKTAAPKDWETAEVYLNRVLMTDTNGDVDTSGKKRAKSVPAADLEKVLTEKFGESGTKTLAEFVRIKAIERKGDQYVSAPMGQFYRRSGPSMSGGAVEADPSVDTVLSEQQQLEKAAVLFDLDIRTGMRHGVELPKGTQGVYDMNARSIALGQFDLPTFFHELGHDLAMADIGRHSSPMPAVQNELVAIAKANKQPALMSEGAAELGRLYVNNPKGTAKAYPTATKWFENLLQNRGLKERVDSIVDEHQKWLKASPEQRRKAAIVAKETLAEKDKSAAVGGRWYKLRTLLSTRLFDRVANLRSVSRELPAPKDVYDDAYEAKMLEAGWAKAAADSFINGFITDPRTGHRDPGFGAVLDKATQLGVTPDEFTNWQAYMAGMSIFDKSPRIRRRVFTKLGIDETKHGAWSITGDSLPDPFDTMDDVIAANREMDLQWEQKAAQNKTLGKPPPPKPVHYKLRDPSPGTGSDAPTNFTEAQLEDFARIIGEHNTESPFHSLAVTHMQAVNARDAWRFRNGLITATSLKSHQAHSYYIPLRTETADGQRIKIKGSGGADIIAPYEQLWDKVRTDHFYAYSQAAPRAWLRWLTGVKADRIAAGEQHSEDLAPLARLMSFTNLDEAVRNYASIEAKIKRTGQESPVVDEYVITSLDEPTIDSLMQAGMINPLLVKDPKALIGTHIAYRVEDPEIRSALGDPAIPWTPAAHWILRGPASVLRKLTTVFNPEFWVKTVVRDTYQAGLQTAAGRNPVRFVGSLGKGVMDAYTNASNLASDRAKTDPIYAAFVQSGITSSSLLADAGNVTSVLSSHDLSRALSMMGAYQPRFGWLRSLATPMSRVADTVEGFNRAAEFRRAVTDGLGKAGVGSLDKLTERQARSLLISAARHAQEVTVNFRRMGSWSPLRAINEVVPFFQATIEGSRRGLAALTFQARFPGESVGKRLVNGLTVYTLLAMPVLLQHLLLGDPEDRDQYSELPDNERMLFYHFPAGKTPDGRTRFVKVPKPQGVFTGMIAAMEKMMSDDPRTWHDIAADTYAQTAPQSYVPTTLQLGLELAGFPRMGALGGMGTTPYRLEGVEGDAQDAPWLSPSSYAVSHALTALGISGMTPLKTENLLRGYTGGLGWTVLDVPPTLQDLVGKHERASYDAGSYPITRLFLTRDPAFSSRSISRMYDMLDVLNSQRKTYEQEISRAEMGQQTPEQAVSNILDNPLVGFGKEADDALKDFRVQLGKSRTMWESINRDATMDPIQRRIEMDKIVEQIVDASRLAYKTVNDVAQKSKVPLAVPRR
jgi:hypothetical protein